MQYIMNGTSSTIWVSTPSRCEDMGRWGGGERSHGDGASVVRGPASWAIKARVAYTDDGD